MRDQDGTILATCINNQPVYYETENSFVSILVDGDRKGILLANATGITIEIVATDQGEMSFEAEHLLNAFGQQDALEVSYSGIALTSDKQMQYHFADIEDLTKNNLFVVDENNMRTATIERDGSETVIGCYNSDDDEAHSWSEAKVTVTATCESAGEKFTTCLACGKTKTETISALGHAFGAWTVVEEPTCQTEGVEERICANDSSHKETRVLATTDHTDNNNDGHCDTCGEQMTGGDHCAYCGKIHSGFAGFFTKIAHSILNFFTNLFGRKDKHTHDYMAVVTEPTCTEGGYTTYTCSSCGDSYTDNQTAPLGHDFGAWIVDAEPTCETEGLRHHICSRCEAKIEEALPLAAHVDKDDDGTCDVCGKVIENTGSNEETGNDSNTDTGNTNACAYCGKDHTGFFGGITKFIHNLFYRLGGKKK